MPNDAAVIPLPKEKSFQKFFKRGSRKALTLSRLSLGFYTEVENGVIWEIRAAAGSMSPIPLRLSGLESALKMKRLTPELAEEAAAVAYDENAFANSSSRLPKNDGARTGIAMRVQ